MPIKDSNDKKIQLKHVTKQINIISKQVKSTSDAKVKAKLNDDLKKLTTQKNDLEKYFATEKKNTKISSNQAKQRKGYSRESQVLQKQLRKAQQKYEDVNAKYLKAQNGADAAMSAETEMNSIRAKIKTLQAQKDAKNKPEIAELTTQLKKLSSQKISNADAVKSLDSFKKHQALAKAEVDKIQAKLDKINEYLHDGKDKNFDSNVVSDPALISELKRGIAYINKQTRANSKQILTKKKVISLTGYKPDSEKYIIELNDVKKSYLTGDLEYRVLKGVNLKVAQGDFLVILGPSGSGKTTMLNIISGLDKASYGDVFVSGYNLTLLKDTDLTKFRRKEVGFIFQQYNLLTNLTAKENAEVGENLAKNKKAGLKLLDIFDTIGMRDEINKYPNQLSGGQQQRVSIARALAKNPAILFCDEPTGALDEEMGRRVLEILLEVNRKYRTTLIVVTHNPNIAQIANTVIQFKNGIIQHVIHNEKPAQPSEIKWS